MILSCSVGRVSGDKRSSLVLTVEVGADAISRLADTEWVREVSNAVGRSATEAIFVLDTLRPVRRFGDLVSIAVAIGSVDVVSRVAACIQSEAVAEEFIISGRVELPGLVSVLAAACLSNCAANAPR